MTLRYYDISRTLSAEMAVWPGDTPFKLRPTGSLSDGDAVNVTTLTLSAHTGTHVDAPYHFTPDGLTMEAVDPAIYWGMAQVVSVSRVAGLLTSNDFAGIDLRLAPRLLIHSAVSETDPHVFHHNYVYPGPELADFLGAEGIRLFGTDAPSVDPSDSKTMAGHHALQRNGILILEGLNLTDVPDGLYDLVALPLKIAHGDGSPVRAVLRTLAAQ
ncbi:MAG: cyclase family protein [Chloroflexota bacterium]|jgi:arylformamidase